MLQQVETIYQQKQKTQTFSSQSLSFSLISNAEGTSSDEITAARFIRIIVEWKPRMS